MNWIKKYLYMIGIIVLIAGFFYDTLFAGIPYQDANAEMIKTYNLHAHIAEMIMRIGIITLVIGLLIKIIMRKSTDLNKV